MKDGVTSKPSPSSISDNSEVDTISLSSQGDCETDGALVLQDEVDQAIPSFGNVSVMNSTDIHFGNKTVYQGPVTIKQFLYANGSAKPGENVCDVIDKKCNRDVDLNSTSATVQSNGYDNHSFQNDKLKTCNNGDRIVAQSDVAANVNKGIQWIEKLSNPRIFLLAFTLGIAIIALITLMVVVLPNNSPLPESIHVPRIDSNEQENNTPIEYQDTSANVPSKLKIISRLEWLAQPALNVTDLITPVPYVIIWHTATENCTSQAQCVFLVRYMQTFHIESRHWWDIGYSFMIGGDGLAYEGRGWKYEGAHTYGYNSRSIGIAFIGTFISSKPPDYQIHTCKQLIQKGVDMGYIQKGYKILAARQLQKTEAPGLALYNDIRTWEHWASMP